MDYIFRISVYCSCMVPDLLIPGSPEPLPRTYEGGLGITHFGVDTGRMLSCIWMQQHKRATLSTIASPSHSTSLSVKPRGETPKLVTSRERMSKMLLEPKSGCSSVEDNNGWCRVEMFLAAVNSRSRSGNWRSLPSMRASILAPQSPWGQVFGFCHLGLAEN